MTILDWVLLVTNFGGCYISLYVIVQYFRDLGEHGLARIFRALAILLTPFAVFAVVLGVLR